MDLEMNENEAQRIAAAVNALRPDWPLRSLRTFISAHLAARTYADAAVALTFVAVDPKTETPKRVLEAGPWWKAATTDTATTRREPTRAEACADCGRTESTHGDYAWHKFVPMDRAAEGRTPEGAALARAELAQTRANTCPCGVDPKRCAEHHPDKPERVKPATEQETEERLMEVAE